MLVVFESFKRSLIGLLLVFAMLATPARSEKVDRENQFSDSCALAIVWVLIGVPVYFSGLGGYLCDSTVGCVRATVAYFRPHPTTVIEHPNTVILNPSHSVISGETGDIYFDTDESGRSRRRAYRLVPVPDGSEENRTIFYLDAL